MKGREMIKTVIRYYFSTAGMPGVVFVFCYSAYLAVSIVSGHTRFPFLAFISVLSYAGIFFVCVTNFLKRQYLNAIGNLLCLFVLPSAVLAVFSWGKW